MDPASFSFAVVGIFLTCCKGYRVFSDVRKAPSDGQDAARRIRIEGSVLAGWGEHFAIRENSQGSDRLKVHLSSSSTRSGVFDALCAISDTFTDIRKLDKKYGIIFTFHSRGDRSPRIPRDVQDFLDGRDGSRSPMTAPLDAVDDAMKRELTHHKAKMSLLERCRWSLRGKERIHSLIRDLRRYNDDLIRLCSWEAAGHINRGLPTVSLSQSENFMDLHLMADISEEAAKDTASPVAEGRRRIAEMARFKAKMNTPSKLSKRYKPGWRLLDQHEYTVRSSNHPYSLGTNMRNQEPAFIEWQSYKDPDDLPNEDAEEQILKLAELLSIPDRPNEFRALDCVGLFKDRKNDRYGVVFDLPTHLRGLPNRVHPSSRSIYNPSTLTQLMDNVDGIIDLGLRFDLAKKLVYSVVVLHTCGWLHKNICSDNVLFFPAQAAPGDRMKNKFKDVGRPIIVGYGLSRPDDILMKYTVQTGGGGGISRTTPVEFSRGDRQQPPKSRLPDPVKPDEKQPSLKIYQHPDKVAQPPRRFRHSYDIYSLGLLLLEIGLWQSLQDLEQSRGKDIQVFHKFVNERLVPELWGQCGSIYGGVVRDCLTMSTDDEVLGAENQRRLAWDIAERLDRCVA